MAATSGYQAGQETNAVVFSYAPEATWSTLPATTFQAVRMTSESLAGSKQRARPPEVPVGRQASAAVTTQESASGAINFALSYGTYDDLLGGALGADWATALAIDSITTDIAFVASGNKMTSTLTGKFNSIVVGQWIKVTGAAASSGANNGWYRVSAKASGTDVTLAGKTVVNETASAGNIKVRGQNIRNGSLFKSFYGQKQLGSSLYLRYPGFYVAGATLGVSTGQFFTGNFNLLAKSEDKATADASTGGVTAAPTGKVHDGVAGFRGLYLDDALVAATVSNFSLQMQNEGAAAQYGLGSGAAAGMLGGTFTASGTMETYFKDFTLYDRFKNETGGVLSMITADATGAAYVMTLTNATIMNPQVVAGGPNQAVMARFAVEGNPDPTTGITFQIDKAA